MDIVSVIGFMAAFCTTIAYLPQLIKVMHSRRTRDLSIVTFLLIFFGLSLWLVYGILLKDMPLIVANVITLCFVSLILIHKIRYG